MDGRRSTNENYIQILSRRTKFVINKINTEVKNYKSSAVILNVVIFQQLWKREC